MEHSCLLMTGRMRKEWKAPPLPLHPYLGYITSYYVGNNCERLPHLQTVSEAGDQACESLEATEDLIHSLPVKEKFLCLASRLADLTVRLPLSSIVYFGMKSVLSLGCFCFEFGGKK